MDKEKLYLQILNNLQDGVYFVDTQRRITLWNTGAERITGYSAAEIVNKSCQSSGLSHIDLEGHPLCHLGCPLFNTLTDGKQRQHEVLVRHKQGYRIPLIVNIFPVYDQGTILGAVEIFTKKTSTVYEDELIDQLSSCAMQDHLTQLPNRRYFSSFLAYRLEEYKRFGRAFAVTFADIDNFSTVNNTYGHDIGDQVLVNIANTLMQNLRRDDLFGRWGGEEFVGVHRITSPQQCSRIGQRFCTLVRNTEVVCEDHIIRTTVSLGVTMARPEDSVESLIKRADELMYRSKKNGKDQMSCDVPA